MLLTHMYPATSCADLRDAQGPLPTPDAIARVDVPSRIAAMPEEGPIAPGPRLTRMTNMERDEGNGLVAGITPSDAATVVELRGDIDTATAPEFLELIEGLDATCPVVFDLSLVTFVDSTGLRGFIQAFQRCGHLTIRGASPTALRLLQLTGLDKQFDISD
jgi:anti-anti-sigma factor